MNKIKFMILVLIIILIMLVSTLIVIKSRISEVNINSSDNTIAEDDEKRQDKLIELAKYSVQEENTYTIFALNDLIQKSFNVNTKYYIQDVYSLATNEKATCYTYGVSIKDNALEKCYRKINIDYKNEAYEIKTLTNEEYEKAKAGKINTLEDFSIVKNANNEYNEEFLSTGKVINRYIEDFKMKIKYMPEEAYNILDDEYKNKKYKSIDDFKVYIQTSGNRFDEFKISQMRKRNRRKISKIYCYR